MHSMRTSSLYGHRNHVCAQVALSLRLCETENVFPIIDITYAYDEESMLVTSCRKATLQLSSCKISSSARSF